MEDRSVEATEREEEEILLSPRGRMGAVMVVGGGVSGVQASLDLAGLGYHYQR
jgi:heterodisulfide reductase subunit A-like polyferredoxin